MDFYWLHPVRFVLLSAILFILPNVKSVATNAVFASNSDINLAQFTRQKQYVYYAAKQLVCMYNDILIFQDRVADISGEC
jgi:hypothetical protein